MDNSLSNHANVTTVIDASGFETSLPSSGDSEKLQHKKFVKPASMQIR